MKKRCRSKIGKGKRVGAIEKDHRGEDERKKKKLNWGEKEMQV